MKNNRKLTFIFFIIGCLLLVMAYIIGIADNLPGILLLYLGTIALILSFVHSWRKPRKFKILTIVSIIGIPVFIILYNLLYGLSKMSAEITLLSSFLNLLSVLSFLLAIIVCPAGLLIGLVGAVIIKSKNNKKTT